MKLIETHAHLNFAEFHEDLENVIEQSRVSGIEVIVNVGTDLVTSQESVNLAERYQFIFATVGVHPHSAAELPDTLSQLKHLATHPKVVAIGEIGLDYFRNLASHTDQVAAFQEQLKLALQIRKPVVLHCRDAYTEVLQILADDYIPQVGTRVPGIVHSFTAGPAVVRRFLQMGFFIGLNNIVTYPKNTSLREAIKDIPLTRIVLETDCPYLPPQALRGQRCEPQYVLEVAKTIAEIKGLSVAEVAAQTTANAKIAFGL